MNANNGGYKKAGICKWLVGNPAIDPWNKERIASDNEKVLQIARELGLPMDRDFGHFDTIEEAESGVPEEYRKNGLFIIRCAPRAGGQPERDLFVPWERVVSFVAALPGGYQKYRLGVREVTIPIWSGTIICSDGGDSVLLELWKGKHLDMDNGGVDTSFRGVFRDRPGYPRRFVWSEGCTDEMKHMMLDAFRYFAPNLRSTEEFFVEFSLTKEGYRFHGLSFNPFWTERLKPQPKSPFPIWGD